MSVKACAPRCSRRGTEIEDNAPWASLGKQTPFRGATACVLPIGELARALRSIGAKRVRREGRQWVWRMGDSRRAVKR